MPLSEMIRLELKFLKVSRIKSLKVHFIFIFLSFQNLKKKDYVTQKQLNSGKEKEERKRMKKKEKIKID